MTVRISEKPVDERALIAPPSESLALPDVRNRTSAREIPGRTAAPALARASATLAAAIAPEGGLARALETERLRGGGFILAPALFAAGAYAYTVAAREPSLPALAFSMMLAATLVWLARRSVAARALALIPAFLVAGALAGKVEALRRGTATLGSAVATEMTGRIASVERQASGRIRLTIDVVSTKAPVLRFAPDRIRVTSASLFAGAGPGDGVSGRVRLLPPSGPARPGGYDFAWRAWFDGVGANGFFLGQPRAAELPPPGWRVRLAATMESLRAAMAERVRLRLGGPEGEVATALIVGETAGVPKDLVDAMQVSGLFHILSISGLHMALVAGLVMGGLRLAFAVFPRFVERHAVKKFAAGAALAAAAFYLFLSGAGVATQRSFVMIAVMLAAVMADRAALTMRNLAIAAFVIVAVAPHEVAGPSFQMSFAATAALIAGWSAFSRWRARRLTGPRLDTPARAALRWLGSAIGGVAIASLLAGGATSLFAAWHFHRVAPLGLFANLAATPVISGVVMPAGVAAALAMPFGLDGPFLDVMGKGIETMNAIAVWFAARSPLDGVGLVPGVAVVAFTAGLVIAAATSTRLALASLPFFLAAALLAFSGAPPDAFVSEDGRLVGVVEGGRMVVNRARPNAFVLDQWRAAADVESTVKPGPEGFACHDETCVLKRDGDAFVAHAPDADAAKPLCAEAALIVIADAASKTPCQRGEATVILRRALARRGGAAVTFAATPTGLRARVEHAVAEPFRPWHAHRAFSRAARGLPDRPEPGGAPSAD